MTQISAGMSMVSKKYISISAFTKHYSHLPWRYVDLVNGLKFYVSERIDIGKSTHEILFKYHRRKIIVCTLRVIVCKWSVLTPIEY